MMNVTGADGTLVLPAGSLAVAVMVWLPGARLLMQLHMPLASAIAVQTTTPFSETVTVAPASAVPVMTGLVVELLPLAGPVITGALTTVSLVVLPTAVPVPATLVCDTEMVAGPCGRLVPSTVVAYMPFTHGVVTVTVPMVMVTTPAAVSHMPDTGIIVTLVWLITGG